MSGLAAFFTTPPSPLQVQVEAATSELLLGADWGKNMEICDSINRDPQSCEGFAKAFKKRLATKNPKVILLTLQLIDATVKNCGFEMHSVLSQNWFVFLDPLARGKRGTDVQEEALALIQRCGKAFQSMQREAPMFYKLLVTLRQDGFHFPADQDGQTDSAVFNAAPPSVVQAARTSQSVPSAVTRAPPAPAAPRGTGVKPSGDPLLQLRKDLSSVQDRAGRFNRLLLENRKSGEPLNMKSDAFLDEVDYLCQCQLRLRDLVESMSSNANLFEETIFSKCLDVNDLVGDALRNAQTLGGYEGGAGGGMPGNSADVAKPASPKTGVTVGGSEDLLGLSNMTVGPASTTVPVPSATHAKSEADDLFDALFEDDDEGGSLPPAPLNPEEPALPASLATTAPSYNPFDMFSGETSPYGSVDQDQDVRDQS